MMGEGGVQYGIIKLIYTFTPGKSYSSCTAGCLRYHGSQLTLNYDDTDESHTSHR